MPELHFSKRRALRDRWGTSIEPLMRMGPSRLRPPKTFVAPDVTEGRS